MKEWHMLCAQQLNTNNDLIASSNSISLPRTVAYTSALSLCDDN